MRSIARYMPGIILFIATGIFPTQRLAHQPALFLFTAHGRRLGLKKVTEELQANGHHVSANPDRAGARMHWRGRI